jgi:steroid delta-isomerase-like uncharacterized protein
MDTETPTPSEVARTIFEALSKRDLDTAMKFNTDDAVDDFVAIGEFRGRLAIRRFFDELLAAFPDFAIAVDRIVGDDSAAVVQWHAAGTFSGGKFQGIEPTGKRVQIRGVEVMEFAEGRYVHNTIYYDGASFARQIGMLPRAGSGAEKATLFGFNASTRLRQRRNRRRATR